MGMIRKLWQAFVKLLKLLAWRTAPPVICPAISEAPHTIDGSYTIFLDPDNDQIQQRKRHLAEIAELGHPIYPTRFIRTHTISEIFNHYHSYAGKREDEAEAARINAELKMAEGGEIRLA